MAQTTYCAIADIQNILSADGVTYRTDDSPPDTYGDVIDAASAVIDEHCFIWVLPATLATNEWVKHRAAEVASYYLCERRGNPVPPGVAQRYERAMERLELVRLGRLQIPNCAVRKTQVPVLSNGRIRLDPFPRTVIEKKRSTGKPEGYTQHADRLDTLDYSI